MTDSAFLTAVVHGESKVGKTWLGASSPTPILVLDAEAGGFRFVPGEQIVWDPQREPIPENPPDIVRVKLRDRATLGAVLDMIRMGDHPFKSIVVDSLTEYQSRIKREMFPSGVIDQQGWGSILLDIEDRVMSLRDLAEDDDQLQSIVLIAHSEMRDEKQRPMMQGAMKNKLSYKLDMTGYLFKTRDDSGNLRRGLRVVGDGKVDAGNRPIGDKPEVIWDPSISGIISEYMKEKS